MEDGARCVCFIWAEHVSEGHWGSICCTDLGICYEEDTYKYRWCGWWCDQYRFWDHLVVIQMYSNSKHGSITKMLLSGFRSIILEIKDEKWLQIECTQILFSSKPCLNKHSTTLMTNATHSNAWKWRIRFPRGGDKTALLSAIDETTSWLDANQAAEKEEYEE